MSIVKGAARAAATFAAAGALSCAMAQAAFAATPYPVSTAVSPGAVGGVSAQVDDGSGSAADRVALNIVDFQGTPGETVFVSAKIGDKQVANFLPHELGTSTEGTGAESGADVSADAFAIEVARSEVQAKVEAGIHVDVYETRSGGVAFRTTSAPSTLASKTPRANR